MRTFTQFVKSHFIETSNLIGVEVGVCRGHNAKTIRDYLHPQMLILVDAWNESVSRCEGLTPGYTHDENMLCTYQHFATDIDVIIIKGLSCDVAKLLRGKVDFVYVDARHPAALDDIKCWYPLVRDGGVFGGHDYNMKSVSGAVSVFFTDCLNKVSIGWREGDAKVEDDGVVRYQGIDWWVVK